MHNVKDIFLMFLSVATFRTPPQELPTSEIVLLISVVFALLVGLVKFAVVGSEYYSFLRIILELIVPAVLIYLLLFFFKMPNRFSQTFAALTGSGAVIFLIALPVMPSLLAATDTVEHEIATYIIIAINLWSLAVIAYILKHAMNVGLGTGISLAVALILLTMMVIEGISPSIQPASGDQGISSGTVEKL